MRKISGAIIVVGALSLGGLSGPAHGYGIPAHEAMTDESLVQQGELDRYLSVSTQWTSR